ncbi:MAG: HAMP domain-containing methyl-accepting chemotaxis protein [Burkholderiales bacterium]
MKLSIFAAMKLWQKLTVLILLLLIPIGLLMYLLVAEKNIAIKFAKKEIEGVEYLIPVQQLARNLAQHRAANYAYLSGHLQAGETIGAMTAVIERDLAFVEAMDAKYKSQFASGEKWQSVKDGWSKLKIAKLSAEDSFKEHGSLLAKVQDLYFHVGDTSNLILDPDLDSFYLMDVMVVKLASLMPDLAAIGARGAGFAARETITEDERIALINMLANSRQSLEQMLRSLQVAFKNNSRLTDILDSKGKKFVREAEHLLSSIDQHVVRSGGVMRGNAGDTLIALTRAIDEETALYAENASTLSELLEIRIGRFERNKTFTIGIVILLLVAAMAIGLLVIRSITRPLGRLTDVARRVASGDKMARTKLATQDEFGGLAQQFDGMLDQQAALTNKIENENEQLNNSVLNLLQVVAKLAQKDLTAKATVAEDATGAVADALNLMTSETAYVLSQVVDVAEGVAEASEEVRKGADIAMNGAMDDKIRVEMAAAELATAARTMIDIAKLALQSNDAAAKAIATTDKAQETVLGTVQGITAIRDVIRETEKRIKRLGERSQEIGGVVSLINNIAERTHILALNASMHAASAGEAGRGFAVVANEVQRLAENAREATAQISTLVGSIQTETADTVTTMNETISQVVEGTKMAEQAGAQMRETRASTAELVKLVAQINKSSSEQAEVSQQLVKRAGEIEVSTRETLSELQKQSSFVARLVEYSNRLVTAVGVFTLPKSERAIKEDMEKTSVNLRKVA